MTIVAVILGGLLLASPATGTPENDSDARFAAGEYAAAQRGYEQLLARRPDAVPLRWRAAVAAALAGDHAAAERHALRVAVLDPGNAAAADLAALARARADRAAKRPPPTPAECRRALDDGRLRTAERLAAAALAAGPDEATRRALHWVRGRALLGLGRAREALSAFEAAAGLGPVDPALWAELGEAARRIDDDALARYFQSVAARALPDRRPRGARDRPDAPGDPPSAGRGP